MSEEHFGIKTPRYTFHSTLKTLKYNGNPFQYTILFGGVKEECVTINVDAQVNDDRFVAVMKPNVAKIPLISYDPRCSLDVQLDKGEGTRYMIKTAINFVKHKFPYVDTFELDDKSYFECADGMQVSLPHYSVAVYDKTWYERNFGAKLQDEYLCERYNDAKKMFSDESKKLPFQAIQTRYFPTNNNFQKLLENVYEKSDTYNDFFMKLKNEHTDKFCDMTKEWLEVFVNDILGQNYLNNRWIIQSIPSNVRITEIIRLDKGFKFVQKGGKRNKKVHFVINGTL